MICNPIINAYQKANLQSFSVTYIWLTLITIFYFELPVVSYLLIRGPSFSGRRLLTDSPSYHPSTMIHFHACTAPGQWECSVGILKQAHSRGLLYQGTVSLVPYVTRPSWHTSTRGPGLRTPHWPAEPFWELHCRWRLFLPHLPSPFPFTCQPCTVV